jgi:hypothetical protein
LPQSIETRKVIVDNAPFVRHKHESLVMREYFNTLRSKGIQGSNTDFLICAVSTRNNMPIFSNDNDFNHYKKRMLSLGKAADLAGMSRFEFIDYLRFNDEPVFEYTDEELEEIKRETILL